MNQDLLREAFAGLRRGWNLTPLNGKVPFLKDWPNLPHPTESQVTAWVVAGHNLGVITGETSGVDVLDEDAEGIWDDVPLTVTCKTGGGGAHYFVNHEKNVGCPTGFEWGEVKGQGGMVVLAGSIHPETGEKYEWAEGLSPDEWVIEDLPHHILEEILAHKDTPDTEFTYDDSHANPRWAHAAINREYAKLMKAQAGGRNNAINFAAFRVGQVLHHLPVTEQERVVNQVLELALSITPDEQDKTEKTVHRGISDGQKKPRWPRKQAAKPGEDMGYVLVPGSHQDDAGMTIKVTEADFCEEVYEALPKERLFRIGDELGEVFEGRFRPVSADRLRLMAGHLDFCLWKQGKKGSVLVATRLSKDLAGVLREYLCTVVPPLHAITEHPIYLGGKLSTGSGYRQGFWVNTPALDVTTDTRRIRGLLEDLFCDYPFDTDADRANFFGLLVTPVIRPAVPIAPAHYVSASRPRTGKTAIVNEVMGNVLLGRYVGTVAPPSGRNADEDLRKTLFASALTGQWILLLDNLVGMIDYPCLASFLTSPTISGRPLFSKTVQSVRNTTTMVLNGNNNELVTDMANRCVPIRLETPYTDLSRRPAFRHAKIGDVALERRPELLGAIVGAVQGWIESGKPSPPRTLTGYEPWSHVVGGIMEHLGYPEWLTNAAQFREDSDPFETAASRFLEAMRPRGKFFPREALVVGEDIFEIDGQTPRAKQTKMGQILQRLIGRHFQTGVLRKKKAKDGFVYHVEETVEL